MSAVVGIGAESVS